MQFTLKIITGVEVWTLLEDEFFLSSWLELAKKDRKVTVSQEPAFVIPWYKQYTSTYVPILCLAYDKKGALAGLMPLAKNINDDTFTHAGAGEAEYHGWIAHREIDEDFPAECLIRLKNTSNIKTWQWRWLAPRTPVKWFSSQLLTYEGIYVRLRTQASPLWDLGDKTKYEKILKNRALRSKVNRYKRKGPYYIERITDKERTRELIDILRIQFDFRREAVNNVRPFGDDPNKASFYIERQNYPDNNHFTVLWSDHRPIAFHFGACDHDTLYLGLSSYDPVESKNSPGTLLLIELGKMLFEAGYRYLDLTPGGDQYKERFANAYQKLVEPKFYFNKQEKIKDDIIHRIKLIAKNILSHVTTDPHRIRHLAINLRVVKSLTPTKIFRRIIRLIYDNSTYLLYRLLTETVEISSVRDPEINVQKYADLLAFTESNPWATRQDLLLEALKRFSAGEKLYSIIKKGILVHYGWMTNGGEEHRFAEVDMTFNSPPGSIILYDFYTEPQFRRQGLYQRSMKQMILDACEMGAKEIYISIRPDDLVSRRMIEKAGFFPFCTFSKKRFLWICKKKSNIPAFHYASNARD